LSKGAYNTWMPLYVADYLRKTTRLTTEQHGAYMLLIMDYWVNGAPPDDDTALAQIVRLPLSTWRKHRGVILSLPGQAFSVKDGKWIHDRIEDERMKALAITEVKRAGGKERQRLAAEARARAEAEQATGRQQSRQQKSSSGGDLPPRTINNPSSSESGSAREPQPLEGAGSLDPAKPLGSLTSGVASRLLEKAAGKRF
jgi:uncharacterized protein YdaU (DUF1376 family)